MGIRESRLIQWAYEQVMRHEREKEQKIVTKIKDVDYDTRVGEGHWMNQGNVCEGMGSRPMASGRCRQCLREDVKVTKKGKLFRHKNVMK